MDKERILDLIEKVIESYERMLQEVVIKRDKDFNSTPFEQAMSALNFVLRQYEEEGKK